MSLRHNHDRCLATREVLNRVGDKWSVSSSGRSVVARGASTICVIDRRDLAAHAHAHLGGSRARSGLVSAPCSRRSRQVDYALTKQGLTLLEPSRAVRLGGRQSHDRQERGIASTSEATARQEARRGRASDRTSAPARGTVARRP